MRQLISLIISLASSILMYGQGNNYIQNYQKFEGLALTPPMGWNSWNKFACNVNEKLIRQTADAMVATGMKDAGYTYINIDDCWLASLIGKLSNLFYSC